MDAERIAEIEDALRGQIPNDPYDPTNPRVIACIPCGGGSDDHRASCYVPLVYELLDTVKHADHCTEAERAVIDTAIAWYQAGPFTPSGAVADAVGSLLAARVKREERGE